MENNINKLGHDIRNMKKLTQEQINLIKILSHDEKTKIILLYDEILEHINNIMINT